MKLEEEKTMRATVTILETNFEVEWTFKITASGSPETGPSYYSGGEPATGAEFELEVLSLHLPKQDAELELPKWLNDLIATDLYERDDINDIVQQADYERGSYDPDDERL